MFNIGTKSAIGALWRWYSARFLILNIGLSAISLQLGALFYGYGFAVALLITILVAIQLLERKLNKLEYETFMLQ